MNPKRELNALAERAAALRTTIERLRDELDAIQGEERELRARLGLAPEGSEAGGPPEAGFDHLDRAAAKITPFDSEPSDAKTTVDSILPPPPLARVHDPLPHPAPMLLSTPPSAMLLRAGVVGAALMLGVALIALVMVDLLVQRRSGREESSTVATAAQVPIAPAVSAKPEAPPGGPIPDPPPPGSVESTPPPPSLSSAVIPIVPRVVPDLPVSAQAPKSPRPSNSRDYGF